MISKKIILFIVFIYSINIFGQEEKINWITFEQLEDSLSVTPKKVFISFYTKWCKYCKKIDQATYKNSDIIKELNTQYYSVTMDAESSDIVTFDEKKYINKWHGKKRNSLHQIPELLLFREKKPITFPGIVILDENFQVMSRYFNYLSPKALIKILKGKSLIKM